MDIPLLYESGELVNFMHKIIVVRCEGPQQVERLLSRTKMTKEQAEQRVSAQMALDLKAERADYVIDNTTDITLTQQQVDKLVIDIRRSKFHWKVNYFSINYLVFFSSSDTDIHFSSHHHTNNRNRNFFFLYL